MYPTREQAQALLNCTQKCRQCINDAFCEKWSTLDIGSYFIEFHDALDAKQAELDNMKVADAIYRDALDGRTEALDWTANRCDELALEAGQTKIELDKAKDLIKRFVNNDNNQGTMEFSIWWNEMNSIMDEAEAMLIGKTSENVNG